MPEVDRLKNEVLSVFYDFLSVVQNKELMSIAEFHGMLNNFTKYDVFPPYTLQSSETALAYEQSIFANISDLKLEITNTRVDIFNQDTAIITFLLHYSGVYVYDYSFEGRIIDIKTRGSMVMVKENNSWSIVHEHISELPSL